MNYYQVSCICESLKSLAFVSMGCAALLLIVSLEVSPSTNRIPTCTCVAFRLDDIQDYFLDHVQVEVMNVFERRNMSLTVGLIGNYIGSDPMIVNYIKSRTGDPLFEVANHGWEHEDFTELDVEGQSSLMQRTNEKIFNLLAIKPTVFIAPYNSVNNDTFVAVQENGMHYISANMTYDPPPYDISSGNQSLYRFPETVLMGDLSADNTYWITFSRQEVFDGIEESLDQHGFAVVTMHPQDFAVRDMLNYQNMVDYNQINELKMLLDKIQERGIKVVTISEINSHVPAQEQSVYVQAAQPRKEEELAAG
jgi:peptidoglycan/xylan/chitin deacetylase (PgdA/CDA1 family)